jgi:hypothetical protein
MTVTLFVWGLIAFSQSHLGSKSFYDWRPMVTLRDMSYEEAAANCHKTAAALGYKPENHKCIDNRGNVR